MNTFITDDFLLNTAPARTLYHDFAAAAPIFDYHCHLDPKEIYENRTFSSIGEAWLAGDHYKWRLMRACGVPEQYITGSASFREKFERFAAIMPTLVGNPIYHWSHLELKRFFGIDTLLSAQTAEEIWDRANDVLCTTGARTLITQSNVRALCTTDDPADDLHYHALLGQDSSFAVQVLPTFRPDKVLHIQNEAYPAYLVRLGQAAHMEIRTLNDLSDALSARCAYFAAHGCRLSDHSFGAPDFTVWDEKAAAAAMDKALAGMQPYEYETAAYQSYVMQQLSALYVKHGFVMQLHLGAQRNLSTRQFAALGADVGCDAIGDTISAASLAALLDRMDTNDRLPRTILYTLNAADNDKLIAAAGCFQDGTVSGKLQFGSAWWFNDHFEGMLTQLKSLSSIGVLSRFVGMLTDSRSFLSYPRHEYFRRILCRMVGEWVQEGMAPPDYEMLGEMIQNICFHNATDYIGLDN